VRIIEIAGRRSFVALGLDEAAILGEFEDAAVARGIATMAIGNKNIAIGRNRHTGPADRRHLCPCGRRPSCQASSASCRSRRAWTETGGDAGRHGVEAAMEDPNIAVAVWTCTRMTSPQRPPYIFWAGSASLRQGVREATITVRMISSQLSPVIRDGPFRSRRRRAVSQLLAGCSMCDPRHTPWMP